MKGMSLEKFAEFFKRWRKETRILKTAGNSKRLNLTRFLVMGVLLLICTWLEYYFHFLLGTHIVYTHLFYIPIVLAAMWWGLIKGGLPVSLFLAFLHVAPHLPSVESSVISRGLAFVFIGSVIGVVSDRRKWAERVTEAIFLGSGEGIRTINTDYTITNQNEEMGRLCDVDKTEAAGKKCYEVFPGSLCHTPDCPLTRILGGEERVEYDVEKERKDGTRTLCIVTAVPLRGLGGELIGIIENFHDITERKRAKDALLGEKAYTDNIIKTMIDTLIVVDPDGEIKTVNQATLNLLGYKEEELIGKPVGMIFAEEEEEEEELIFKGTRLQKLIKEGSVRDYDMTYLAKDGRKIPMTFSGSAMRDKEGKLVGVVGVARDMREIKKLISDLGEAKTYAENIITNFLDTLIVVNPDGTIRTVNQATLDLLGYKEEELIGKPVGMIFAEEEEEEVLFTGKLKDLAEKGTVRNYEMTYVTKSGRHVPMSFNGSVMRDEKGNMVGIVAGAKDISGIKKLIDDLEKSRDETKRAFRELKETQAKLIQTGKMAAIGTLAAGIAHQLNQPLAGIRGFAQAMLMEVDEKNPLYKDLKKIEEQTSYMRDIIENVRGFARQSEFRKEPININEPLEKTLGLLSGQLRVHGIELVKNLDPNLPKVNADFNQMQQVFANFIVNAREAMDGMPKGAKKELVITTRSVMDNKRGTGIRHPKLETYEGAEFVEVLFSDNGPGIPGKIRDRIFEPFFTTKGPRNVGLGLSLNHQMIEDHNGSVEVESSRSEGAVFRITLPATKKRARAKGGK